MPPLTHTAANPPAGSSTSWTKSGVETNASSVIVTSRVAMPPSDWRISRTCGFAKSSIVAKAMPPAWPIAACDHSSSVPCRRVGPDTVAPVVSTIV